MPNLCRLTMAAVLCAAVAACSPDEPELPRSTSYDDLVQLFVEWREFQRPPLLADRVPDYSADAMRAQYDALPEMRRRLAAIDANGWPVGQQVDYHLVRAEMNGLEFDHRVLRPWARNPAFYRLVFPAQTDVPAREGPVAYGAIELWDYDYPLTRDAAAQIAAQLNRIPPLLDQARVNLVEDARDLWHMGIVALRRQSRDLAAFRKRVEGTGPDLGAAITAAAGATDAFVEWLESEEPSRTGPSGVGIDNYNWYLANVQLLPYTWEDELAIMRRELARAHAFLALEEHRNRDQPPLVPIASEEQYDRDLNAAVTEYMEFLQESEIVSVRDYMDGALRARIGTFSPSSGPRPFFSQVNYRDPVVMRTHGYHWFDLARMEREPHASAIRRVPLLYNIFDARAEGMATGMEEMMMQAGLFDQRPRARELIYILLAQRAARAIGGLMMHANQYTLEEASAFASAWTPRGWMPVDGPTVTGEQHLYLQQPAYGTSYIIGKIEIEKLMAERARQLGDAFSLKRFMDEFNAVGVIPVSLARWELTGNKDEIERMMQR